MMPGITCNSSWQKQIPSSKIMHLFRIKQQYFSIIHVNVSWIAITLFSQSFGEAHNATADVEATTRCFLELVRRGNFTQEELQEGAKELREEVGVLNSITAPFGFTPFPKWL